MASLDSRTFTASEAQIVGEIYEHTIDWSDKLVSGETIATSTWALDSTLTSENESSTDTTSTLWVSASTDKTTVSKCTIVTNIPRTYIALLEIYTNIETLT